jgi:hypothetical protein
MTSLPFYALSSFFAVKAGTPPVNFLKFLNTNKTRRENMPQMWIDIVGSMAAALLLAGIPILILHKFSDTDNHRSDDESHQGK